MIYQFPFETSVFISLWDLSLIGLTLATTKINKSFWRNLSLVLILFLFGFVSLIKVFGTSPGSGASTPNDIILKSDSKIGVFYLSSSTEEGYHIFWRGKINGNEGTLTIEMEGVYPDRLIILKNINGEFKELQPRLDFTSDTYKPISINISNSEFRPISNKGVEAIDKNWKNEKANFASNLISLLFILMFLWISLKKTPKPAMNDVIISLQSR